jgi:Cu(I)/Ag(I) efflux system protein CusF
MMRLALPAMILAAKVPLVSCNRPPDQREGPRGATIVQGPPATSEVADQIMGRAHSRVIVAESHGIVTAGDETAGTITVDHGRIPEARWRAGATRFKTAPAIASQAMVGEDMDVTIKAIGNFAEVTAIQTRP